MTLCVAGDPPGAQPPSHQMWAMQYGGEAYPKGAFVGAQAAASAAANYDWDETERGPKKRKAAPAPRTKYPDGYVAFNHVLCPSKTTPVEPKNP